MDYKETIDFLFNSFPMFEKTGGSAYNPGLERIEELCNYFGNPQNKFKSVHIAGTNGKGSSSHLLASVLQCAGYKVGLYTSPHLKEFTERMKINGVEIPKEEITSFVNDNYDFFKSYKASFFEITTVMAFNFFAKEKVDIAIVETGLGGRLDATNILLPEVCLITNISFDHMQYLGNTLTMIAAEKAGVIKENVPVVVSERHPETELPFEIAASVKNAKLIYAEDEYIIDRIVFLEGKMIADIRLKNVPVPASLPCGLGGFYQEKNIKGVLAVLNILHKQGWKISDSHIFKGFAEVVTLTGLKGRWHILEHEPMVICDTAHNEAGIGYVAEQLKTMSYDKLFIVLGVVKDKDITRILELLPKEAYYFFTMPSIPRALPAIELYDKAVIAGLQGDLVLTGVKEALTMAKNAAGKNDLIYVGGSTFVVAEVI